MKRVITPSLPIGRVEPRLEAERMDWEGACQMIPRQTRRAMDQVRDAVRRVKQTVKQAMR